MDTPSKRQIIILTAVIETHIETGQPVGSRYVAERYPLSASSATVRHEMGSLEEMGYLMHPHTSSGRIPTDHGYRYYVDHGFSRETLPRTFFDKIAEDLSNEANEDEELDHFLDRTTSILSSISHEVGLIFLPDPEETLSREPDHFKLSFQGLPHILEKPEFQDIHKVRALIQAFEEKRISKEWVLRNASQEHISVSIGREHQDEVLEDCAIVAARYKARTKGEGTLAILGPKRMRYRRIVPLVSQMAQVITERL